MVAEESEEADLEEAYGGGGGGGNPVIFVQPCPFPGADYQVISTAWQPFIDFLVSKGWPSSKLINWVPNAGLPTCYSTHDQALALRTKVMQVRAANGNAKVDLIGASGGALTIRYYLGVLGGASSVESAVSLVGPNHGTNFGLAGGDLQIAFGAPSYEQLKETYPPYACAGQTYFGQSRDIQLAINGCLTLTGRTSVKDETPGTVRYVSIYNTIDDQIIPMQSACLNMTKQNDCASSVNKAFTIPPGDCPFPPTGNVCPAHIRPIFDPGVWDEMCRHISGSGTCAF